MTDTNPLAPTLQPMLAQLARELPAGDYFYEPKWDGFRCLAFVERGGVDLRSRHQRPLARYFPELVEALRGLRRDLVLDGEIVVAGASAFDFEALLGRLHPSSSRVEQLRHEAPASLIAFDLLALGPQDLRARAFEERRALLEGLLGKAKSPLLITPATRDVSVARDWLRLLPGAGIDGVVAKHRSLAYRPGQRAMIKVKRECTADCVVGGFRVFSGVREVASLLLGLYDAQGDLVHVGVSSSFQAGRRRELWEALRPLAMPLRGHPWEHGFNVGRSPIGRLAGSAGRWDPASMEQDWIAIRPERVCEVAYDRLDGMRLRHPARFVRWRPDRDPASCTTEQLIAPPSRQCRDGCARGEPSAS